MGVLEKMAKYHIVQMHVLRKLQPVKEHLAFGAALSLFGLFLAEGKAFC